MKTTSIKHPAIALLAFVLSIGSAQAVVNVSVLDGRTAAVDLTTAVNDLATHNAAPIGGTAKYIGYNTGETWGQSFTLSQQTQLSCIYIGFSGYETNSTLTLTLDVDNDGSDDHTFTGINFNSGTQHVGGDGTNTWSYLCLDLSSENITLDAGQHSFLTSMTAMGTTDPTRQYAFLAARGGTYAGGGLISNTPATGDMYFGVSGTVVPEPETFALIFGALSFSFVMLRRRFKA